tara:strand:+ start:902 stop:1075 length:174 start_codon:yes stop_codon:yes gene_type:complete
MPRIIRDRSPPLGAGLRGRVGRGFLALGFGFAAVSRGATGVLGVWAIGRLLVDFFPA